MKIFLDDVRPTPPGWIRTYWPEEVIEHLKTSDVAAISLDHDLGDDEHGTGYDVLLWIEEQVFLHGFNPPAEIYIHSDNSSAVQKMKNAVDSIRRLAKRSSAHV